MRTARRWRRVILAAAIAAATFATGAVAPSPAGAAVLPAVSVKLTTVATGLDQPVALGWRHNDARLYVAEKTGKLRIVNTNGSLGATVLNVAGNLPVSLGGEQGLLGFAFNAAGTKLYVDYTGTNGDIHIVEYTMSGDTAGSPRQVLAIPHHDHNNHNGGQVTFGPDGYLYIGVGDGGGGGDTDGNAQNLNVMLGKILRINPAQSGGNAYTVPSDNPFVGRAGLDEIWMYGLRNPWRWSFDRLTHDLWIGDVGQGLFEEIDHAAPGQKGTNWGWNRREGLHAFNGGTKPAGAQDPVVEKSHDDDYCAIIGGYVYHSSAIPYLDGAYVYGDSCRPQISALVRSGNTASAQRDLGVSVSNLTTFGESPASELYLASGNGQIYKLAPRTRALGYWEAATDGRVFGYNGAASCNSSRGAPVGVVGIAGATSGYWLATRTGAIGACNIPSHGSMAGKHLNLPIVGIAGTPTDSGYWMVASDGGIFSFGDARFRGSTGGHHINQPIVGMASTPTGRGYWLVASDGGIFAFGDARFKGSTGGHHINKPIVGMAATSTGGGYWLVASDGGIFTFGDAVFRGSAGGRSVPAPITGMAATPSGNGYWMVGADGALYIFGDAHNNGTALRKNSRIMGIAHDFPHIAPN